MNDGPRQEVFDRLALDFAISIGAFEAFILRAKDTLNASEWSTFVTMTVDALNNNEFEFSALLTNQDSWEIRHAMEDFLSAVIPQLNFNIDRILQLIKAASHNWHGSGTPGYMMVAFSEWCGRDEGRVDRALAAIRAGLAPTDLLIPTLVVGLKIAEQRYLDLISDMLIGPSDHEAKAAAFSLGNMAPSEVTTSNLATAYLLRALTTTFLDRRGANFEAIIKLSETLGDTATAVAAVRQLTGISTPNVRQAAANALFSNKVLVSNLEVFEALCGLLRETPPGEIETIDAIDHALYFSIEGENAPAALNFMKDFLRARISQLRDLDSTTGKLRTWAPNKLEPIVADWLASESYELTQAVADLIRTGLGDPLALSPDFTNFALNEIQAGAIARRVVASLILYPIAAISILLSLAKTGPQSAMGSIEQVIMDPLLISYWEGPRKYIEERSLNETTPIREMISRLLDRLREYIAAIEALGVVNEMQPSERHRFISAVKQQEDQRTITEDAHKGSLASLFPMSILLYGDSVVSEVFSGDGASTRNEFRMGTVKYSQEIPRLERIDPIGFWLQRAMFTMGKPRS